MLGLSDAPVEPAGAPPVTPQQAPPVAHVETPSAEVAEREDPENYQRPVYPENVRRNPFQPVLAVVAPLESITTNEELRPIEPLEQYNLGQLELVVVISETAVPKAMFLDPDGFGHVIKEGDRIGLQNGIVTDIRNNEVDVRESGGTGEDAEQSSIRTIRLREVELRAENEDKKDDLSEREREALQRLLETSEGREAIKESLRNQAVDQEVSPARRSTRGIAPPTR